MNDIGDIYQKNILLLQGPMGFFFKKIDSEFRKKGAYTHKIGFNVADRFFSHGDNYTAYRDTMEKWPSFIDDFLIDNSIDQIFLFGDCRYYQNVSIEKSMKLGIEVFVFEEGYLRPDFITLERYGVNDFSRISRDPNFYSDLDIAKFSNIEIVNAHPKYYRRGWSATTYYLLSSLLWFRYPYYKHHRQFDLVNEGFWGIRNLFRKYKYKITEKSTIDNLHNQYKDLYYFVPLQTYNDFQVLVHSDFSSIETFIQHVMNSFAKSAPKDTLIVIKHHPEDRGRKDYRRYIDSLAKSLSISDRVVIIYDMHLPSCIKNSIGTVTINSTVGISSLYHNRPTIALGSAIYDIDGLTCNSMTLDDFWEGYKVPDKDLFEKFKQFLTHTTQLNGSFYGKFPDELSSNSSRKN
ncbi:MAG: capsular biosynthesis protein [Campylobacterota bacterium]|nr:capsular biosynthesis protein [Campylobacterota bacterium]